MGREQRLLFAGRTRRVSPSVGAVHSAGAVSASAVCRRCSTAAGDKSSRWYALFCFYRGGARG